MSKLFLVFSLFSAQIDAGTGQTPVRIYVTPFENGSGQRSQDYLSLLIAATLIERLERVGVDVAAGPLMLDETQARLVSADRRRVDLDAAVTAAQAAGATHLLTGTYRGPVERWTVEVSLHALTERGRGVEGSRGRVDGSRATYALNAVGKRVPAEDVGALHGLLSSAVEQAFVGAGIPANEIAAAIAPAGTADHYACVLLSRAYARLFLEEGDESALEKAKDAAKIDPDYPEAQRFYGTLLLRAKRPREARPRFETVLAALPDDRHSLIALADIEELLGNDDFAAKYLERALVRFPYSVELHLRLARAFTTIGQDDEALTHYEQARNASPGRSDIRIILAERYAERGRHIDAAAEYSAAASVSIEPDAAFGQIACLRAAGRRQDALIVADAHARRWSNDGRLRKMIGDLFIETGRFDEADVAYAAAYAMMPEDRRLSAIAAGKSSSVLGGKDLVAAVKRAAELADQLEAVRSAAQDAANDALIDLAIHGRDGCEADREDDPPSGVRSSALAAKSRVKHAEVSAMLDDTIAAVHLAFRHGEALALAPDERAAFVRAEHVVERSSRDRSELVSQFRDHLVPALRRHGCEALVDIVTPADIVDVRVRLAGRKVHRSVATSKSSVPRIGRYPVRIVQFTVDNRGGTRQRTVVLDGKDRGVIAPGAAAVFTATFGRHVLCLVDSPEDCGQPGTTRKVILHDGFTIVVPSSHR